MNKTLAKIRAIAEAAQAAKQAQFSMDLSSPPAELIQAANATLSALDALADICTPALVLNLVTLAELVDEMDGDHTNCGSVCFTPPTECDCGFIKVQAAYLTLEDAE